MKKDLQCFQIQRKTLCIRIKFSKIKNNYCQKTINTNSDI